MGVAIYFDSTIYLNTRKEIAEDLLQDEEEFDRTVVHELSHGLLEKLRESAGLLPVSMEFGEGFAHYCDTIWFSDLYSKNPMGLKPRLGGYISLNFEFGLSSAGVYYYLMKQSMMKGEKRIIDIVLEDY